MSPARRFSEIMWFKKGELADLAAAAPGEDAVDLEDGVPLDERYDDDGSLTESDSARYSLSVPGAAERVCAPTPWPRQVTERELIGELTLASPRLVAALAVVVLVGAPVIALLQ